MGNALRLEQEVKEFLHEKISFFKPKKIGECASYIPELKKQNPHHLAFALLLPTGELITEGDVQVPFTQQSISKVLTFIVACMENGLSSVLQWVDVEPTGDPFHSFYRMELQKLEKSFHPFVNAGALTVASLLPGDHHQQKIHSVTNALSQWLNKELKIHQKVFQSEWESANRNQAIAHLLMERNLLNANVEETLLTYIKLCSMEVTVEDLAKIALILSQDGFDPLNNKQLIPREIARITKVLMFNYGMYNASGQFALTVGIPAKSGVSGGVMAVIPPSSRNHSLLTHGGGIGVYSPALVSFGNSIKGIKLLEAFVEKYEVHLF